MSKDGQRERLKKEEVLPCRHIIDREAVFRLQRLLPRLARVAPKLLAEENIPTDENEYQLLYRVAVETVRGEFSAAVGEKKRFTEAILDYLKTRQLIRQWIAKGSKRRQDYLVELKDGYKICIEAKGAGDGNNLTIWERPSWADEFVIWSQNPHSLKHEPGAGVWSALSIRLFPKILVEKQNVDAFVFFDGRCGSSIRRCPKKFGIEGELRSDATDIPGQDDRKWLPPPSIYLMPRRVVHPEDNPKPPVHTTDSCRFAAVLLKAFNVPRRHWSQYVNRAEVETKRDSEGTYMKVSLSAGLGSESPVVSNFKKIKRTT